MPNASDIEEKLGRFVAVLRADAAEESSRILAEIRQESAAALAVAENEYLTETYAYIRSEVARAQSESGRRVSRVLQECKRTLYERRQEIAETVASDVLKRVRAYTQTPAYTEQLHSLVQRAREQFGEDEVCLYVRPDDTVLLDGLLPDPQIRLGGLLAVCPNRKQILDLTFDASFEESKGHMNELFGQEIASGRDINQP